MGPLMVAQSPNFADATVTSIGLTGDGSWTLAPGLRLLSSIRADIVQASLDGMDRTGMVTGPAPTPTPRALFLATYGYSGDGDESEVNIGGGLRLEKDIDAGAGRLFAGIRRKVRTADPRERYFASFTPGIVPQIYRTWIGNPGLSPEKHHLIEIGGGWARGAWELAGRAFADHVTDFILWDRARGQRGLLRADGVNIFRNIDAVIAGFEARARYRFDNGFWTGGEFWATYGENLTDDRAIAQIPPLEASLRAGWMNEKFEIEGRWRLVATQNRTDDSILTGSGADGDGTGSRIGGGFTTVDISAAWKPRPNFRLSVGVENIFDKQYAEYIERTDINDPFRFNPDAAGRSFWGRASVRF
jgi:iron complex outermembrane receptor protein